MTKSEGASCDQSSNFRTSVSLLDRIRSSDDHAWARFYAIYSPLILYMCRRHGLQDSDGEDVAQEVYQAVITGIDRYRREHDGRVRSFRSWLGGVIRNKISDALRRESSRPQARDDLDGLGPRTCPPDPEPGEDDGEKEADREVLRRALEAICQEFAPRQWQAFWRTSVDNQTAPAVGAELGMTAAAVRQARARVLRRLREELCEASD